MMRSTNKAIALALAIVLIQSTLGFGQGTTTQDAQNKQPSEQERAVHLRAEEVIVDVVVTDKKNKPVVDLTADDFEVYENGVKQKVLSFRLESKAQLVESPGAKVAKPGIEVSGTSSSPASRIPNLITFVFDAISNRDSASLARRAALDYIETEFSQILVLTLGPNLNCHVLRHRERV